MKLLHVINSMDPAMGGPCQGIRNVIEESERLGIYREVACLDDPSADYLGKDSFRIHALGPKVGLWLYPSYGAWKAIKSYKKTSSKELKIFVMPHGMLDPYFQKTSTRKLKAIRNWFYWEFLEKNVVNDADCLLFTCEEELQLARDTFSSYHPKNTKNVGYGIEEPPVFSDSMSAAFYAKCPEVKNKPYLLFLSRINYKKGIDLLIKSYSMVLTDYTSRGKEVPKLVIAGPGLDTAYGEKMLDLVSEHANLKGQVFFPGMLSGPSKWGAFYGCEAFILPSHQENFGIALVEALACRKPVLTTSQVNIWREITEGNAGFIVDDTLDGTKELLEKFLTLDDVTKCNMGLNARSTFEYNFSIKNSVRRFTDVITAF
ncbi:MAG: glycosyltransferase [Spirosoma sp.]|uniref:glycosyltransferase n=1 Tax=Spirosoma sp. TaxID=1899569 RepID=UPI001AC520C0|nr:glycosyltransferase [Spirosoma sp.]MBN8820847.1 glycosyltransferase [Spirosoma sp.]